MNKREQKKEPGNNEAAGITSDNKDTGLAERPEERRKEKKRRKEEKKRR